VQDYALDPARVVIIHNPVDVACWSRRAETARKSNAPWGSFAEGRPVLICAGRLIKQKGFDLVLRALAECRGEGRRAHLVVLGEGPLRTELGTLACELGISDRLLMPGFVADPAPWYAHGELFLLPSRWEGFGHVIVEAMACGLPVIAFDCPYGPADILTNRQGGILIGPNDVSGLARAIDRLLASPDERKNLKAAGRRSVERFALARIAAQYADLIEKVAEKR
jgi:glycosyltransferase involved in cell wall biosynthesis